MEFKKHEETKKPFVEIMLSKGHTDPLPFEMFSAKDSVYRIVVDAHYYCGNEYCKRNNADAYLYEFNNCKLDSVYCNIRSKTCTENLTYGDCDSSDFLYFHSDDYKINKEVGCEKIYECVCGSSIDEIKETEKTN
jgi:hypothetical protein